MKSGETDSSYRHPCSLSIIFIFGSINIQNYYTIRTIIITHLYKNNNNNNSNTSDNLKATLFIDLYIIYIKIKKLYIYIYIRNRVNKYKIM